MMQTWLLLTGASEGIGKEFARFAAEKGRSLILSARSEDKLNALADELRTAHGVEVVVIPADLTEPDAAAKLWDAAIADGRKIDFLVNNAGLGRHGWFGSEEDGDGGWARELASIQVNVVALTDLMNRAVPHMKAHVERGRILNIASVAAFLPGPRMAVYNATKAYVLSLSRAVQEEWDSPDFTVTAMCPGATESNFFKDANMRSARLTGMAPLPSARSVAEAAYHAAIRGQSVMVPGLMNKVTTWAVKLLPAAITAKLSKYMMEKV